MVKQAIADSTPFGICAIREGAETGAPAVPYSIGTRVRITDWDMPQTGILHIDTQAQERFVVRSTHTEPNGLLIGSVEAVSVEVSRRHSRRSRARRRNPAPHHQANTATRISPRRTISTMPCGSATACPKCCRSSSASKQNLLEMNDSITRLRILTEFLKKQIN